MKNKQLPLFLILLMMLLVACGGGDDESSQAGAIDLPLVETAASDVADVVSEEAEMEEVSDEMAEAPTEEAAATDEAMEADAEVAEETDAAPEEEAAMADDEAMAEEDAEAEAETDIDADAEADSMDAEDAMDASEESADEAAMDEESAESSADTSEEDADDASTEDAAVTEDLSGTTVYVVQDGDSLSEIAETFGVPSADLLTANNIENADQIFVGQPLIIPGGGDSAETTPDNDSATSESEETAAPDIEGEYTVQAGDTLSELAEDWEIPARAIAAKNGISDQDGLFTGQILLIPAADEIDTLLAQPLPEPINQPGTYVVQPGDSLAGIAIAFGVSQSDLANANNIVDFDTVFVGQTLVIP